MGITKNKQSEEKIIKMVENAFPGKKMQSYEDDGQYRWVAPLYEASLKELKR